MKNINLPYLYTSIYTRGNIHVHVHVYNLPSLPFSFPFLSFPFHDHNHNHNHKYKNSHIRRKKILILIIILILSRNDYQQRTTALRHYNITVCRISRELSFIHSFIHSHHDIPFPHSTTAIAIAPPIITPHSSAAPRMKRIPDIDCLL